jgi:hypothetical protein
MELSNWRCHFVDISFHLFVLYLYIIAVIFNRLNHHHESKTAAYRSSVISKSTR